MSEEKYYLFIKSVCTNEEVWTLKNKEGYVTSDSTMYETEDGEAYPLFCFWSSKEEAESCAIEGWSSYTPEKIDLPDFIENWCVALSDEEALAGISFDKDMFGWEQEPLQLILDLVDELHTQQKTLSYQKFSKIEELTEIIRKL